MSIFRLEKDRLTGVMLVAALHCAALWGLWSHRLIPSPAEATTLFVNFIAPLPEHAPLPPSPKPRPIAKPQARPLVAETPVIAATDYVAPPPPPTPAPAAAVETPPMPLPAGPVALSSELSVGCPERSAPAYPAMSRRLGETGVVVLRVELGESGQVASASLKKSSGFSRLDEAALDAVRSWRCNPATRNGHPVRAVALQPFNFVLQGN